MSIDVSIDLETLSLRPNAVILSVGLVAFHSEMPDFKPIKQAHVFLHQGINAQLRRNRVIDGDTILWWFSQPNVTQFKRYEDDPQPDITYALHELHEFFDQIPDCKVWGNGSDFDVANLATLFQDFGFPVPWKYNHVRDLRTLANASKNKVTVTFTGEQHNALNDAMYQAEKIYRLHRELKR